MTNCYLCKIEIKHIPYRCKFCGMIFCNKHRLPENHDCPFDLRKKNKALNSLEKPLYQDALDFMNKDLDVAKIYDYVTTNQMTKGEAIALLNYLLEKNDNTEIRKVCIQAFKILNLKEDKAYRILESCLISDEDSEVKSMAFDIIGVLFPKRSKDLLNWFSQNYKNWKE